MRWLVLCGFVLLPLELAQAGDWIASKHRGPRHFIGKDVGLFGTKSYRFFDNQIQFGALKKCRDSVGFHPSGTCANGIVNPSKRPVTDVWHVHLQAPHKFPDTLWATRSQRGDGSLISVWYAEPTRRYQHGVFGEGEELGALVVDNKIGKKIDAPNSEAEVIGLPVDQVFEDRVPRITDLDGFGKTHLVTILTEVTQGASVAVFGIEDSKLTLLAQTPYIGTPNRWLNIAGIDDFDGSGSSSIALVETPHIGGVLQFWRWSSAEDGEATLTKIAEAPGFSNHKFGSREQRLSAVEDFDNDGVSDLAVPSDDRRSLRLVKIVDGNVVDIATIKLPSPIDKAIGVSREGDDVVLTVGLEDGSVYAVHR